MIDPYILVQWQWGTKLQEFHIALCSVSKHASRHASETEQYQDIFFLDRGGGRGLGGS